MRIGNLLTSIGKGVRKYAKKTWKLIQNPSRYGGRLLPASASSSLLNETRRVLWCGV
jgi:hypothetical protein